MPDRLFAIGDIHGCSIALKALIEAIDPRPDETIVVLGDVIDYGPRTDEVIAQLIDLSNRCQLILLTGNHEEMLFRAAESPSELNIWIYSGGEDTLKCYPGREENVLIDPEHFDFLKSRCRDFHETVGYIFAHANYDPDLPMDRQPSLKLRWEFLDEPRQRPHFSGKSVIVGHTPQTSGEVLNLDFLRCIDTDCSRGGWLTGLEVRSGRVIQANQNGETRLDEQRPIAT
ncbi:metallophosphoesterase family protein [soil metagenome]